jgi:hypothetical protein
MWRGLEPNSEQKLPLHCDMEIPLPRLDYSWLWAVTRIVGGEKCEVAPLSSPMRQYWLTRYNTVLLQKLTTLRFLYTQEVHCRVANGPRLASLLRPVQFNLLHNHCPYSFNVHLNLGIRPEVFWSWKQYISQKGSFSSIRLHSARFFITLFSSSKRTWFWGGYFDRRERKWGEVGENCILRNSITCTLLQVQLEWSNQGGWDGQGM